MELTELLNSGLGSGNHFLALELGKCPRRLFEMILDSLRPSQVFEQSGLQLMADSQYDAPTRIQVMLEFLHEREMDLEDLAEQKRTKLEQCVHLRQYEMEARQVGRSHCGREKQKRVVHEMKAAQSCLNFYVLVHVFCV